MFHEFVAIDLTEPRGEAVTFASLYRRSMETLYTLSEEREQPATVVSLNLADAAPEDTNDLFLALDAELSSGTVSTQHGVHTQYPAYRLETTDGRRVWARSGALHGKGVSGSTLITLVGEQGQDGLNGKASPFTSIWACRGRLLPDHLAKLYNLSQ